MYRTVHRPRVAIRAQPSTEAEIVHVLATGEVFRVSWRTSIDSQRSWVSHSLQTIPNHSNLCNNPPTSHIIEDTVPLWLFILYKDILKDIYKFCTHITKVYKVKHDLNFELITINYHRYLIHASERTTFGSSKATADGTSGWVRLADCEAWARNITGGFVLIHGARLGGLAVGMLPGWVN